MQVTHIAPVPQSQDCYYATNNPYQVSGPRGFTELKYMEDTTDLFVRLDFPGVTKEKVKIILESSKKAVLVSGEAPKEHIHDSSGREYGTATGLTCDCCVVSNVQCFGGDGVLRLIISKENINYHAHTFYSSFARMPAVAAPAPPILPDADDADSDVDPTLAHLIRGYNPEVAGGHPLAHLRGHNPEGRHGTDPLDPAFTGPVTIPNPLVLEGSKSAYESKQLPDGSLFLRIDMPGVPENDFNVMVIDGVVTVTGRAPQAIYDSSGRDYEGKVAVVPRDYDLNRIEKTVKYGVIRLVIPPN
ncbi:hypothetical protein AALP_AA6G332700 [Arabis alpina]|uniref:SHSP domain-containing protein n=1 Tax=Arabis alpina TaxID=50452 RepID=A0A087GTB1_ARAAL|nr:hypothetical protein AALP_AA6G332700 [Arabis alpina]